MQQSKDQPVFVQAGASIVGVWRVDAEGAPFVAHLALFHADGRLLIHHPDAGNPHSSASLGVGVWKVERDRPNTIMGDFEEITADRASHQYVHQLRVTFTLTLEEAQAFTGPAETTYSTAQGTKQHETPPAKLIGTRILL